MSLKNALGLLVTFDWVKIVNNYNICKSNKVMVTITEKVIIVKPTYCPPLFM